MRTRTMKDGGIDAPGSRRSRWLVVLVVALVGAGLVWWRVGGEEGASPSVDQQRLAVPGVVRTVTSDDSPDVVLVERGLARDERRAALAGVSPTLEGLGLVRVGVDGATEIDGTPAATVELGGEDTGDSVDLLADLLPVLVASASRPGDEARASVLPSGLRVELVAARDRVGVVRSFAVEAGGAGLGPDVTEVEVSGGDGRLQPSGPLRVECSSGVDRLTRTLTAVERLEDPGVVTSGWVEACGDDVYLDVEVPALDDVADVRREARSEVGRRATVNVAVDGGPRILGSRDARVSLRLLDRLEGAGAEVTEIAGSASASVAVDDLAGYAEALRVFAAAAPARDRRLSAVLEDGASYSGPVGAQQRTLPLLLRLDADGWQTFYSGDDPDALSVVTGELDTGVPRYDLTTAPDRRRLIRLLRAGTWPGRLNLFVGGFGDTPGGAGTELGFTSTVDGPARQVAEAGDHGNRDGLLGSRRFVDEWDGSAER